MQAAWVDYEPPETAGSQTHRHIMLQRQAFYAGWLAREKADVGGEARLREALQDLQHAESEYRKAHDEFGDGHIIAGRAWDRMRRAGDKARAALTSTDKEVMGDRVERLILELEDAVEHDTRTQESEVSTAEQIQAATEARLKARAALASLSDVGAVDETL